MGASPAFQLNPNALDEIGRREYDREQIAIESLTRGMRPDTGDMVRKAIQRAIDQGKRRDQVIDGRSELRTQMSELGPCGHMAPSTSCKYCELETDDARAKQLIERTELMLGVRIF